MKNPLILAGHSSEIIGYIIYLKMSCFSLKVMSQSTCAELQIIDFYKADQNVPHIQSISSVKRRV